MGRKIPGKKHRGIKDPLQQQANRLQELKSKINAPPKDIDQQALPRSLERLIQLKEKVKAEKGGKITKKRRKNRDGLISVGKNNSLHPKAKPEKNVPIFEQRPGESNGKFYHRISKETEAFVKETAFERKYSVVVKRNPETGKVEGITKPPKDEFEEKLKMMHKNIKKKKKKQNGETLTKAQKRKLKLQMRKKKRGQHDDEDDKLEYFNDQVKFGEVVHAPPQLTIKSKFNEASNDQRATKKNLLLHSLMKN